ncbi:MAG TPA: Hsp20/alpha crystallin family protein [Steroidobacteraceae bacterium]|jgi:HSP20 family protein|nr:Hsp20/alpha crystallin family protein [Steroidobacteraceae bacterium]
MTLLRYEPWGVVARLQRHFDQAFADIDGSASNGESHAAWIPSVDIHQESDKFVVRADLPGVEPKDIDVTAENGVLTVSGERKFERSEQQKGTSRLERVEGRFVRRFTLPENVQTDHIRARHANGVLELTIPKAAAPEPKKISVETH